jgi:hypothetical protein
MRVSKVKYIVASWVYIPFVLFLLRESWFVDYSAPVVSLLSAVFYVVLALVNFGKDRFRMDLFSLFSSCFCSAIMFLIIYFNTDRLFERMIGLTESLTNKACSTNHVVFSGVWEREVITYYLMSAKIDYMLKDGYVEVRTSPMLLRERVIFKYKCGVGKI